MSLRSSPLEFLFDCAKKKNILSHTQHTDGCCSIHIYCGAGLVSYPAVSSFQWRIESFDEKIRQIKMTRIL